MLHKTSEMAPEAPSRTERLQDRLRLHYERLALRGMRGGFGRGRAVSLAADAGLVRVDDGVRHIYVPNVRRAGVFKNGINAWLETVAEKYVGRTGYVPREGDIVIDVGAGIGEFSLWCADAGARVVAFEPDPLAFVCLEKNTAALGTVQLYPYALWKERANLRLHGSPDTSESSLIEDGRANARNADVEAWPLDRLQFMTRLAVIDFMKIDGEGVEPEILSGASRTLRRTRVIAVDVGATERRPNLRARVEAAACRDGFPRDPERSERHRSSRSTPRWSGRSITAFSVDAVTERLAALERLDLLGDLARERDRIGDRRDMRRDRDGVEIPERALRRQAAPPRRRRGSRRRACRREARSRYRPRRACRRARH